MDFHLITREKLKLAAPDSLLRPQVATFRSLGRYCHEAILTTVSSAKGATKHNILQMLVGAG
jgi:hypothetical protein